MLIASPVNEPPAAALGCVAVGAGVAVAEADAVGFVLGFVVGFFVGFVVGCEVAVAEALGVALGSVCGIPPAIDVVLPKFGGVIVKTAPNPPIVPPAIKSALLI